jgi:molybdopterin synthase sulfur carrier subunit
LNWEVFPSEFQNKLMVYRSLILVNISGHLKDYTGNKRSIEVSDKEVGDVTSLISKLDQIYPGIKDRVFDDQDRTREFVNIFVNGTNVREAEKEYTKLKEGDTVHILPSVSGGMIA